MHFFFKISYINEVANLCEALGADIQQVAQVMGQDGRISPKFLHPGPGYVGHVFQRYSSLSIIIKSWSWNAYDKVAIRTNIFKRIEWLKNEILLAELLKIV